MLSITLHKVFKEYFFKSYFAAKEPFQNTAATEIVIRFLT